MDKQMNGRTENLPIPKDFVPYRGRCPERVYVTEGRTNLPTNGLTDQPTDGYTHSHRGMWTHLKAIKNHERDDGDALPQAAAKFQLHGLVLDDEFDF